MLIIGRGVWVKFEDDGELKDGIIECKLPVGYSVFCKNHMDKPINICSDRIKFVRLNDIDGKTYYANHRLLNEYTEKKYITPVTIFRKEFYNELCMRDATRGESYYGEAVTDPFEIKHYGVKRYSGGYIRHDENALKGAINRMYGSRNNIFNNRFHPKQVLRNGKYTTVVWLDGSHTVVKLAEGEQYDPEKALLYAIVKHLCGDVKAKMDRYLEDFEKVTVYKKPSFKKFLDELDKIDAAGGLNQEYNPDEDETFFDDEEDSDDTE